jgi:hypothetical protein
MACVLQNGRLSECLARTNTPEMRKGRRGGDLFDK